MGESGSFIQKAFFRLRERANSLMASPLRKVWWRAQGMNIGRGTTLPMISATWPHQVEIGNNCLLEPGTMFKYDGIWAPGPSLVIGDGTFLGSSCEFNIRRGITIGRDCLIASGCRFIDHDHGISRRDRPMKEQLGGESPIALEDDVWLGCNVVVLKGVRIGRGSVVGAGAVVTKSIPPCQIWAGVPAARLRVRGEDR